MTKFSRKPWTEEHRDRQMTAIANRRDRPKTDTPRPKFLECEICHSPKTGGQKLSRICASCDRSQRTIRMNKEMAGRHHSEEHKQKISVALKGKATKWLAGRKLSEEE